MSKKNSGPSEADIVFNRASIALAKNQQLVASWLPPRSQAELASAKSQEELDREEEEMFAPVPELLGVGATVPKDKAGMPQRSSASALDQLRIRLLGKKAGPKASKPMPTKPANAPLPTAVAEEPSDDDESRVKAVVSKSSARRSAKRPRSGVEEVEDKQEADAQNTDVQRPKDTLRDNPATTKSTKKRSSTFMDQLLEKKGKKKKKRL